MPIVLQSSVAILCIVFFAFVLRLVSKKRLQLKYSLIWMLLTATTLLFALFPKPLAIFAETLGFATSSNFIFLVGLFFLLAISLSLSVIVSWQSRYIKNLVQEISLLDKRVRDLEANPAKTASDKLYSDLNLNHQPNTIT